MLDLALRILVLHVHVFEECASTGSDVWMNSPRFKLSDDQETYKYGLQ